MIFLNGIEVTNKFFPNSELNLLDIEEAIVNRKGSKFNHIVLKYENDKDLMALYFIKRQIDIRSDKKNILSIAYMPYSRMDRAEKPHIPFMLMAACEFINDMAFDWVYVHEPHSDVTVFLLENVSVVYDNVTFLKKIMKLENFNAKNDFIVFPDKGAMERYDELITSENVLYGTKSRDFSTGEITGLELYGDLMNVKKSEQPTAIIVDDLSSYGGTFIRVSKELYKLGFKRVILLVGHAENSIFKGELFNHVDKVYTTDSILTEHGNWENLKYKTHKLHVFNLMDQLREGSYR